MTAADRRLLLLGDWHWLVRDPLDILRLLFFSGTVAFAVMGRSTAVGLTAASVLLLITRIVNLPRRFDLAVIVAMTFIAWGTALSLYGQYHFYDTIVHGTTPICYAPVLYVCLVRLGVLTDPAETTTKLQDAGIFVSTLAIGMAVGAGYEVVEWLSDSIAGTHFVEDADDTGRDLVADTVGSLVGAAGLTVWSVSSWTSRRITYRPARPPDVRAWLRRLRAALERGRPRLERATAVAASPALAVSGVAAIGFGVLVAGWPEIAIETLALAFGIFAVGWSVVELVVGLIQRHGAISVSLLLDALAGIAAGVVVLAWPRISAAALFYLIAVTMLVAGFAGVAVASALAASVRDRTLLGAASVASMVLGVVVLAWPRETVLALRWLIAAQALVLGLLLVTVSLRVRHRRIV